MTGPSVRKPRPFLVVQHTPTEGPGLIADELRARGHEVLVRRSDVGQRLPALAEIDGLVVLGGPMGVNDGLAYLELERRLLGAAARAGIPVLGVCLGAQLLSAALGGTVTTGPAPEIGFGTVTLTSDDPVLGPAGAVLPVLHWHGDTYSLSEGAVRLASSDRYVEQAFRWGERAYGLQFHIELDAELGQAWRPDFPKDAPYDEARRVEVEAVGRAIVRRWLDR